MAMTATARRVGDTLKHEVEVNGRHVIVTDEPVHLGGRDEGPAPHELLPATLAACISTMIAMYAQRQRLGDRRDSRRGELRQRQPPPTLHDRHSAF